MNIGSLYRVKEYYWILFSSKESASDVLATEQPNAVHLAALGAARYADADAAYYSKKYNENVTYFSPETHIVFLEQDGKFKKVLTSEGLIGWTWFDKGYNDCFEEINQP